MSTEPAGLPRAPAGWFIRTGQYRQVIRAWLTIAFGFTGAVWLGQFVVFGHPSMSLGLPISNLLIVAGVPVAAHVVSDWRWRRREADWLTAVRAARSRLEELEPGVQYYTCGGTRVYISMPSAGLGGRIAVLRLESPSLTEAVSTVLRGAEGGAQVRGSQLWIRPGCAGVLEVPLGGTVSREPDQPAVRIGIPNISVLHGQLLTDPADLQAIALDLAAPQNVDGRAL